MAHEAQIICRGLEEKYLWCIFKSIYGAASTTLIGKSFHIVNNPVWVVKEINARVLERGVSMPSVGIM